LHHAVFRPEVVHIGSYGFVHLSPLRQQSLRRDGANGKDYFNTDTRESLPLAATADQEGIVPDTEPYITPIEGVVILGGGDDAPTRNC
jgi:hypothetical protein